MQSNQKGSVIVLAAILLSVLIAFVALGIDGFRGFSAQTEKQFGADYAAMAALTVYLNNGTLTHPNRVNLAVAKATQIAGENKISADDNRPNFVAGDTFHVGPGSTSPNDVGAIHFGRWWTDRPLVCSTGECPCVGTVPCFQECNLTQGCVDPEGLSLTGFIPADAVSVQLQTKTSQPLVTMFANVIGSGSVLTSSGGTAGGYGGSSIATAAAKHTVFLIDLSRFTTIDKTSASDDYSPYQRNAAGREYSYLLSTATCPLTSSLWTVASPYTANWNGLSAAVKSTYECVQVTYSGINQAYLVANSSNSAAADPKPHKSMVDGLAVALQSFATEASGMGRLNRLAVIGFDARIVRERQWGYNSTGNYGELVRPDNSEIVNLRLNLNSRSGRNQSLLFPRPGSVSDTALALRTAKDILKRHPKFGAVENSVVLITNGLPTCSGIGAAQTCSDFSGTISSQYNAHKLALDQVYQSTVQAIFKPEKIKLHTLYFGRDTAAHSILVKDPGASNCMSDNDLRNRNYLNIIPSTNDVVDQVAFALLGNGGTNNQKYTRGATYFYSSSSTTQGVWGPVRPDCNSISPANWTATFAGLCSTQPNPPSYLTFPLTTGTYAARNNTYGANILDPSGMVLCDPNSPVRTEAQQIQDYLAQFLLPPSTLLVE